MKRFTIFFSILLALGFGAVLAYVAASPEFVPPSQFIGEGEDPDAPIWDMTIEEIIAEIAAQGLIDDPSTVISLSSDGLCTEARQVSGAEFYWWDLDNLKEGSMEETSPLLFRLSYSLERLLQRLGIPLVEVQPQRKRAVVNAAGDVSGAIEIDDPICLQALVGGFLHATLLQVVGQAE